ncbi:hypothetical protein SASPL_128518 [Salvia splendens]|uniref:Uncharacterized protein n=1 Tax=Salvia splendens TaxID=180675 RepID=A0A8X8ZMK3_SALSN|nr:hypothetical protein SASPL_128518 [Salvia splendens]
MESAATSPANTQPRRASLRWSSKSKTSSSEMQNLEFGGESAGTDTDEDVVITGNQEEGGATSSQHTQNTVDIAYECANLNGRDNPCTMVQRRIHWMIPHDAQPWGQSFSFLFSAATILLTPLYIIRPFKETECKWLSHFLDGEFGLPSMGGMEKEIEGWGKYMERYAVPIWYNDLLCRDIGCAPKTKNASFQSCFSTADYNHLSL